MDRPQYKTLIKVKYLSATNKRGSRIKLTNLKNNKTVSWSYDHNFSMVDQALQYLNRNGNKPLIYSESDNAYFIMVDNNIPFKPYYS